MEAAPSRWGNEAQLVQFRWCPTSDLHSSGECRMLSIRLQYAFMLFYQDPGCPKFGKTTNLSIALHFSVISSGKWVGFTQITNLWNKQQKKKHRKKGFCEDIYFIHKGFCEDIYFTPIMFALVEPQTETVPFSSNQQLWKYGFNKIIYFQLFTSVTILHLINLTTYLCTI